MHVRTRCAFASPSPLCVYVHVCVCAFVTMQPTLARCSQPCTRSFLQPFLPSFSRQLLLPLLLPPVPSSFFLRSLLFLFFFVSASSRISYMNIGIGPSLNSSLEFKLREKYSAVFLFFFFLSPSFNLQLRNDFLINTV